MTTVSTFGEKAGDVSKHFLLGPTWLKNGGAAGVKTGVDLVGAAAFQAPFVVMAPFTAGISMVPSTAMTAEALFLAPTGAAHGASEFVDGIKSRNGEQALDGAAEFCGNVGSCCSRRRRRWRPATRSFPPLGRSRSHPRLCQRRQQRPLSQQWFPHDSIRLASLWEKQAADKLARKEYTMGKLDHHGQRINIEIELQGQGTAAGRTSDLRLEPDGTIRLATPFAGFTR